MGASAAVGILHRKQLAAAPPGEREKLHAQLAEEHARVAGGVGRAIEIGVVDEIIEPARTRAVLVEALAAAPARRGPARQHPAVRWLRARSDGRTRPGRRPCAAG